MKLLLLASLIYLLTTNSLSSCAESHLSQATITKVPDDLEQLAIPSDHLLNIDQDNKVDSINQQVMSFNSELIKATTH